MDYNSEPMQSVDDMDVEHLVQELIALDDKINELVNRRMSVRKSIINRRNSLGEVVDQSDGKYYSLTRRDDESMKVASPEYTGRSL